MLNVLLKQLRIGLSLLVLLTVLTGVLYPLLITGIGQTLFSGKANGSLITQNGKVIGSSLIGQHFDSPKYFWGRPSATEPFPYNAASSAASNLGPTNPALISSVKNRLIALKQADPNADGLVPIDLVTESGSGLDPDISIAAAFYQAPRIAKARNLPMATVDNLIQSHIESRQLGILGEPRVNVLELNLALDQVK
ncbi:MAG: kdpC [Gammaproteobacteria bacterium]|jgi:K+-transporting ATPase ATPase C chain|nr:kdpC [Gammaproteobacteria bacterium]